MLAASCSTTNSGRAGVGRQLASVTARGSTAAAPTDSGAPRATVVAGFARRPLSVRCGAATSTTPWSRPGAGGPPARPTGGRRRWPGSFSPVARLFLPVAVQSSRPPAATTATTRPTPGRATPPEGAPRTPGPPHTAPWLDCCRCRRPPFFTVLQGCFSLSCETSAVVRIW